MTSSSELNYLLRKKYWTMTEIMSHIDYIQNEIEQLQHVHSHEVVRYDFY